MKKSIIFTTFILLVLLGTILFFYLLKTNENIPEQKSPILKQVFSSIEFSNPIGLFYTNYFPESVFIVEQEGRIVHVSNISSNYPKKSAFLDISGQVDYGGEKGLLGLAFDPDFSSNGYFYIDYTPSLPLRTHISRFTMFPNNSVDYSSELIILEVLQPYANHNGGEIAFGPDNYLYISLGDGGSGGDPMGNGQNRSVLLGSILRINVNQSNVFVPYTIPNDNPFVNNTQGYKEEIYAYGLRNPWRFSFDNETGNLWAGDVGQNSYEEIDIIEKGRNYGWNIMEGNNCYSNPNCSEEGLTLPIYSYGRSLGTTVTGGYVYHGNNTLIKGKYIFGDFGSGRIWTITKNTESYDVQELLKVDFNIPSFGIDYYQNLYLLDYGGKIYKFN